MSLEARDTEIGDEFAENRWTPRVPQPLFVATGIATIGSLLGLLAVDALPTLFPPHAHNVVAALPLALTAIAYLLYQAVKPPRWPEFGRALALSLAFFLWSVSELLPAIPGATLVNDLAITLFVLDVFVVIIDWPKSRVHEFALISDER